MAPTEKILGRALRTLLPLAILAAGGVGFVVLGQRDPPPSRAEARRVPPVETTPVRDHAGRLVVEVDGVVVPYREVKVAAEVGGRVAVKEDACRPGRFVRAGQPLIRIRDDEYRLQVQQLRSQVEEAEGMLAEAEADIRSLQDEDDPDAGLIRIAQQQLDIQRGNLQRVRELRARSVASTSDLDDAVKSHLTAVNSLRTLENQLSVARAKRARLASAIEVARAKLGLAELDLRRCQVAAPADGVITECHVEQDGYVQEGSTLFVLEDTSKAEVKCSFRVDGELSWVLRQRGAAAGGGDGGDSADPYRLPDVPVKVAYRMGGQEFLWDGRLDRYDGLGLSEKTRTAPVRVVVDDPRNVSIPATPPDGPPPPAEGPRALVRGMFVKVRVFVDPVVRLLEVPERALRPDGDGRCVYRVRDLPQVLRAARVTERDTDAGRAFVLEGLPGGPAREVPAADVAAVDGDGGGELPARVTLNRRVPTVHVVPVRVEHIAGGAAVVRADGADLRAGDRVVTSPMNFVVDGLEVDEQPAARAGGGE